MIPRPPLELINNPQRIDAPLIKELLGQGKRVILQYSDSRYSGDDLLAINRLCETHDERLEIRFYSHIEEGFDAAVLLRLPAVKSLSLDCLLELKNAGAIETLGDLRQFGFGVYYWEDPQILSHIDLSKLNRLVVSDNHRKNIDLSPVARSGKLNQLFIVGQSKGIECLQDLPELKILSLGSIPRPQSLDFVSRIGSLEKLTLILGGRNGKLEVGHTGLHELEILRVRGLDAFVPDLFPSMRSLVVEDQIQLSRLEIGAGNRRLERLRIYNCKNLKSLEGLEHAGVLREIIIGKTGIDNTAILSQKLPQSLEAISFHTGRQKFDRQVREKLDSLGYKGR